MSADPATTPTTRPIGLRRWLDPRTLAAILFPLLLAVLIIGHHAGSGGLGPNSDDFSSDMRNPVTDKVDGGFNPYRRFNYFWRPLHILLCLGSATYLMDHWWVVAIGCSAIHVWASWSVYRLLRLSTQSTLPAAAASLLFMLHPMHYEVSYWLCSISTAIATGLVCTLARLQFSWLRSSPGLVRALLITALIAFIVPCFYEQPAAMVVAMPLVLVASWARSHTESTKPPLTPLGFATRAALFIFAWGVMNIVYVGLMVLTTPKDYRGGSSSFIDPGRALERLSDQLRAAHWNLAGQRFDEVFRGSLELGWQVLNSPGGISVLGVLALGSIAWIVWSGGQYARSPAAEQTTESAASVPAAAPSPFERAIWLLTGPAIFLAGLLPVALIDNQKLEARTLYFPLVGAALLLAQLLDLLLTLLKPLPAVRLVTGTLIGATTAVVCLVFSVSQVGSQEGYRRVHAFDQSVVAQLRRIVPDPPPRTVFVPLRVNRDGFPVNTGLAYFDNARPLLFTAIWAGHALVQREYRRDDLWFAAWSPWTGIGANSFSQDGFLSGWRKRANAPVERTAQDYVEWSRAVPFTIEEDGRVALVRRVVVTAPSGEEIRVDVPIVARLKAQRVDTGPTRFVRIDDRDEAYQPDWLTGWKWPDGTDVHFADMRAWTFPMLATWMRAKQGVPASAEPALRGERSRMIVVLPPSDQPQRYVFRVTVGEFNLSQGQRQGEATFTWSDAATGNELGTVSITDRWVRRHKRWATVGFEVPPHTQPLTLRCDMSVSGGFFHDVWVSAGVRVRKADRTEPAE